jgi:hypothetical protein
MTTSFSSRTVRALVWLPLIFGGMGALLGRAQEPPATAPLARLRFLDSATGFAVRPDFVEATPLDTARPARTVTRNSIRSDGRLAWRLAAGSHRISIAALGYQPLVGTFESSPLASGRAEFQLDPVVLPREIQPDHLATLHRADETVFVGYVSDDESGEPLAEVQVRAEPSGQETQTDARGYFQIYVPLQTWPEATNSPARLSFSRPGFRTEERRYLELWPRGDWVYRVRLNRGVGLKIVDERLLRRSFQYPLVTRDVAEEPSTWPADLLLVSDLGATFSPTNDNFHARAQPVASTASVRIPTHIRVLRKDGVTVDYVSLETYCQRTLPSEWIASWGSMGPGNCGTNALLAGAVAVRTFAVGCVNSPEDLTYDICSTTACQSYLPEASDSRTTAAVNATANYVLFKPGATRVGFKIAEYSAENNSKGLSCGDGFTQPRDGCMADPVCLGESRSGHGRGMCQWGSARWATGRRMQNRQINDGATNGYPLRDWVWLCEHYYPDLVLVQGVPLRVGDPVQVLGAASVGVYQCPAQTITNGALCQQIATKVSGSSGTILAGPVLSAADGVGFTWWQVDWGDTNGWSGENFLERRSPAPAAPTDLVAVPQADGVICLRWRDNAANEMGTYIERAFDPSGPWSVHAFVPADRVSFTDPNVAPEMPYYYRLRTFNQTETSAYSNLATAIACRHPEVLIAVWPPEFDLGRIAAEYDGREPDFAPAAGNENAFPQIRRDGTNVIFTWTSPPDAGFRLQMKTLEAEEWTDLPATETAATPTLTRTEPLGPTPKFFRLQPLP